MKPDVVTWDVRTPKQWEALLSNVVGASFSFDSEYQDHVWPDRVILGFSLAWKLRGTYHKAYIPLMHHRCDRNGVWVRIQTQLTYDQVRPGLQMMFRNAPRVTMHNALTDLKSVHKLGVDTADVALFDTMICSWLLLVDRRIGHGLKELTKKFFRHTMTELVDSAPRETVEDMTKPVLKSGKNKGKYRTKKTGVILMTRVPLDTEIVNYASEDAYYTLLLEEKFEPELAEAGYTKLFHHLCMPQLHYLNEMEEVGMVVDKDMLVEIRDQAVKDARKVEKQLYKLAGHEFNVGSNPQLNKILFGQVKAKLEDGRVTARKGWTVLPSGKHEIGLFPAESVFNIAPKGNPGKSGFYTTGAETMSLYAAEGHEVCQMIMDLSERDHMASMITGWLKRAKKCSDGLWRLFGQFQLHTTRTGRLSSKNPNLQNIPVRGKTYQPRKAFVVKKGFVFLDADFSQVELRILAHLSKDERMLKTMLSGGDIHVETAILAYHLRPPKELDMAGVIKWVKEQHSPERSTSKNVNFASIYGAYAASLSRKFDLPLDEMQSFLNRHRSIFPGMYAWKEQQVERARARGYVKTILGRKRELPDLNIKMPFGISREENSRRWKLKSGAERRAVNSPIQGSAADLIGLAMVRIRNYFRKTGEWLKTIFPAAQIHDELVFYSQKRKADEHLKIILDIMRNVLKLRVPVEVEGKYALSWADAK